MGALVDGLESVPQGRSHNATNTGQIVSHDQAQHFSAMGVTVEGFDVSSGPGIVCGLADHLGKIGDGGH